jgi:hypothetical protein
MTLYGPNLIEYIHNRSDKARTVDEIQKLLQEIISLLVADKLNTIEKDYFLDLTGVLEDRASDIEFDDPIIFPTFIPQFSTVKKLEFDV